MTDLPQVRIFISSPSDVNAERELAERVVLRIAGVWKPYLRLEPKRWERDFYQADRSFQAAIGEMDAFDLLIGILWKRIGSPLPPDRFQRADGSAYESGTVFELETAIARAGKPAVYVFRNTAPVLFAAESVEDDQRQYRLLQSWWERTFRDAEGHFSRGYQTYSSLDQFEQALEGLIETFLREGGYIPEGPAWDIQARGSPFPGLVPYEGELREVFFGRALAVAGALEDLTAAHRRGCPAVFILGPSGSGKSSLMRAGLAPYFAGNQIAGIDFWRAVLLEPAHDPILILSQRFYAGVPELAEGPQGGPDRFAALASESPQTAAASVKWALERAARRHQEQVGGGRLPAGRLLLALDQLETILDGPQQQPMARLIRALVEAETTWVIATLRSDRYPDFQLNADFLELRRRGVLFDLPPPGPSEIADIIKGPARSAGLMFEERDGLPLSKPIGAAVTGSDALPLLQMTLKRLFDARDGLTLTYAAYEAMGGLEGAIAAHAEEVFAAVSPPAQERLDALLRELVEGIDDAGRLTIGTPDRQALAGDSAARELIDRMVEARLLVSADGSIRVAHEALLRRWRRAADSPALQPEAIRLRRQIEPSIRVWQRTRLDSDLLQPGTALAAAESIIRSHPGAFPPDLTDYVEQSVALARARAQAEELKARAEARRARMRASVALAATLVLAVLALATLKLYGDASSNFELALLTKAERLLVEQRPTQALVVAGSLTHSSTVPHLLANIGLASPRGDEAVRIKTIAEITGRASSVPLRSIKSPAAATAGALTSDGRLFAVGHFDGHITVSPRDGGPQQRLLGHSGRIFAMKFSPDDKWLASATSEEILLWDLKSGTAVQICDPAGSSIGDIAFDAEGRWLAWVSKNGRLSVRDLKTGETTSHSDHARWALALDFSPQRHLVASAGDDGMLVVRRSHDWSIYRRIPTGRIDLISLAFSADGKRIATASLAGPVDVWTIDDPQPEHSGRTVPAPPDKRWKIRYSPDGGLLLLASWGGTVGVWDAHTLDYRGTIDGHDHRVNDISMSRDALLLTVVENGVARLWRLNAVRPIFFTIAGDGRETLAGKYSPDGTKFIAAGKDGSAKLYRVHAAGDLEQVCTLDDDNWIFGAAFSADSKQVFTLTVAEGKTAGHHAVKGWDAQSCGRSAATIGDAGVYVQSIAASRRDGRMAWATRSAEIWIRHGDGATSKLPAFHAAPIDAIDFSPDGNRLVSADRNGKVALWNLAAQTLERELRGHRQGVYTIRFSPDGALIASGGPEERILVWDVALPPGRELVREVPIKGGSSRLAFDPTGTIVAVGSGARYLAMWRLPAWEKIYQLNSLVGVRSVYDFHPTRGDLAFDGESGLIRIWSMRAEPRDDARAPIGVLRGMDVFFDEIPTNAMAGEIEPVVARKAACAAPPAR